MTDVGSLEFVAPLWQHPGADGWHFLSLPREVSEEIADLTSGRRRGFGSVKVDVTVGGSSWATSLFPDSRSGTHLLPLKRSVRLAEGLEVDDLVRVHLRLTDL